MSKAPKKEKPRTALNLAPPTAIEEATRETISPARQEPAKAAEPSKIRQGRPPDRMWNNLAGVKDPDFVDLNFKVKLEFRTDFKQTAAAWNMSNKELMLSCYHNFLERYGRTPREAEQKFNQGLIDTPEPPIPQEAPAPEPEEQG